MSLLRSFATVGGWTMASRLLGFARDIVMAAVIGAGPVAEAFFVAFRLPNMFRRFFAEGAFNMAFIPIFSKKLEGDGPALARVFGTEALSALFAALLVLTLLAQLVMPWLVLALASGFSGDSRLDMAVAFSRVLFPYIVFISLAALFSGVLNAFGHFAAAAAAPVLLNVIWVAALGVVWITGWNAGLVLPWAIAGAGLAQLVLVWLAARKLGMGFTPRWPRLTPDVRRLVRVGIPAALAGGVMQINLLVGTQVASYFEGAVVWLWMADRIYQLPLGVVGVAIGVVLLPELSRRFRAGDGAGTANAMNRAAEFCLVLTLPAAVALVVIPQLITEVLFQRGAFTAEDARATGLALAIYAVGLPAFVLQKVLQPAFFAQEDTATPLRYALVSMAVNVVIAIGLAPVFGFLAAALGTTLAGICNLVLLLRGVRRLDPDLTLDDRLATRLPRIALASGGMGALVLAATLGAQTIFPAFPALTLVAVVLLGGLAYWGLGNGLGAISLAEIKSALRRKQRTADDH